MSVMPAIIAQIPMLAVLTLLALPLFAPPRARLRAFSLVIGLMALVPGLFLTYLYLRTGGDWALMQWIAGQTREILADHLVLLQIHAPEAGMLPWLPSLMLGFLMATLAGGLYLTRPKSPAKIAAR